MMNDEHTAWAYVRHSDGTPSTHWWKVCDGQQERVTEEDVLRDPHIVHFLIYTRHEQSADQSDGKTDGGGDAADAKDEESGGSKPKKTNRLDSGLDWWAKTALAVSD